MAYYVYILRNNESRYYVGQTSDLVLRLQRHNEGKVFSTKARRPWALVYSRRLGTRAEAMIEERRLKGLKSREALESLVARQVESRQGRN